MSSLTLTTLVARCRTLCRPQTPDAELLRRFVRQRDPDALEELVRRHAALVWDVCRRVLPDEADCEDAFQATFLALVRQATSLDPRRALGGWLHTVAVRVARKALARSRRQRTGTEFPERTTRGDVADDVGSRELFRMVDEEIERLPAVLRLPVVLCCLQGRTRDEAAEAIGCSVAAVKSRLERGRGLLRRRLERRGIELPAAFLVIGLTGGHVRAALWAETIRSALHAPPPAVAALVPAGALSLTGKLTLTALSLLAAGIVSLGAFRATQAVPSPEPSAPKKDIPSQAPAADKAQPLRDRFGDPLPAGAVRRFGTVRFRHDEIYDLAFTPDGKQLIAGSGRAPLAVFDTATGRKLRDVGKTSPNNPAGFALSPDGKRVACCGFDLFVWEVETGKQVRELGCGRCQSVAFSPDGTKIAAAKEFQPVIHLADAATGKKIAVWTVGEQGQRGWPKHDVRSIAFSPDGKYVMGLFSEYRQGEASFLELVSTRVQLWDAEKGTPAGSFGSGDDPIHAFAFQPGTKRLVTLGKDGSVRFWDLATRKEVRRIAAPKGCGSPTALSFSAEGRRCLLHGKNDALSLLDLKDGRELRRIEAGDTLRRTTIALSPDGRLAALGMLYGEACVRVWDLETGRERLAEAGHRGSATLSLSADGRTLLSRDDGGLRFHWDLRTGEGRLLPAAREEEPPSTWEQGMTGYRGPRWRLTIDWNTMRMEVHSPDGTRLLRRTKVPTMMRGFALSPDGSYLAVSFQDAQKTVFLWNPEKEEKPRLLLGHPDACQKLLFSHDGKRLIAGAGTHNDYRSETVWVWDVATARVVHKLATNSAPGHMLLTADDRVLITGGLWNDAAVRVWDMQTGRRLAELADPSLPATSETNGVGSQLAIAGLALSADERFLAVISLRGNTSALTVWETASWKPVRAFPPDHGRNDTRSMLFARDDRSLFVANSDSTILEWDITGRRSDGRWHGQAPTPQELETCWKALADKDAARAYDAVWTLIDSPERAVALLRKHLSAALPPDAQRVARLLGELDSDDFRVRQRAAEELSKFGDIIVPHLQRILEGKPSLETRRRVLQLLDQARDWTPEGLRDHRAIQVLEHIGTPAARQLLEALAGGATEARRTKEAKAALRYLAR
jgi:RNA polymerase sigma factor (sigma-70 family)